MTPAPPPAARPSWRDLVPALPLLAIGLVGTSRAAANDVGPFRPLDSWAYALIVVAALALLLRRRAPVAALVVCGLATAAYLGAGYPYGPILLCGPAAVWAVAARLPWRQAAAWTTAFVLLTGSAPVMGRAPGEGWLTHLVWGAGWAAVVGGISAIAAARQARRRSEAGVRAEQARRAVSEERLQMAQDMHDGVGHGLAVIAMHAGVALHVLDRDPARARELLSSIQATSREALDGLRADLDRWRSAGDAARRPRAGLEDLPQLLARMRAGGLALVDRIGPCPRVPEDVGAAAYRIVQESLTNVLRHAGGAPAEVRVAATAAALTVEVRDRGAVVPDAPETTGSGIAGMRRRATAVGGRLTAGPAPEGGFVVRADLPLMVPSPVETSGAAP